MRSKATASGLVLFLGVIASGGSARGADPLPSLPSPPAPAPAPEPPDVVVEPPSVTPVPTPVTPPSRMPIPPIVGARPQQSFTPYLAPTPSPSLSPAPAPSPVQSFRLAVQAEGALGATGTFYNQLFGARLDRCFTATTCAGLYAGYANLKGQSGRANNVLFYALVEHDIALGFHGAWYLPLRIATGYLPRNGPFARASAGLGFHIGNVDLTIDLLAPALWVTGARPELSMDWAAEVAFHF